jgi:hypothetical protein
MSLHTAQQIVCEDGLIQKPKCIGAFWQVGVHVLLKETNQYNAQINTYSFTSLNLYDSVSVDHIQGACSYRVQLSMCLHPRYNDSQMC